MRESHVVVLLFLPPLQKAATPDRRPPPLNKAGYFEYRYMTEFQSHEPEFDYLKSLEIEEKINKVRWCRSVGSSKVLLSTNDKTIKLWKVLKAPQNPHRKPSCHFLLLPLPLLPLSLFPSLILMTHFPVCNFFLGKELYFSSLPPFPLPPPTKRNPPSCQ